MKKEQLHIEATADGKQELVAGAEPLKKPGKKSVKKRWLDLKKALDSATAFMPMMDEEQEEAPEDMDTNQESDQGGDLKNLQQVDENSDISEESSGNDLQSGEENPDAEVQPGSPEEQLLQEADQQAEQGEDPHAIEQELAQALKEMGHSDAEIAYIIHGHTLPPPDLEAEKVKSEAMSGQVEAENAANEAQQLSQHRDMEMQLQMEHQKKMNELAQREADEKRGVHKLDQDHKKRMQDIEYEDAQAAKGGGKYEADHKKRMLDLEYESAKKAKELEQQQAMSSTDSIVAQAEAEHKKRMLDLEYENAKKEKELELKFMEAEHKAKLKLMEETSKNKAKQAQEDAKTNAAVQKEKAKHKVSEAKKPPQKKPLKKSDDAEYSAEEYEDAGE